MSSKCTVPKCYGNVEKGVCLNCGASTSTPIPAVESAASILNAKILAVQELLKPADVAPSREDLASAAEQVKSIEPYNFEAWRLHADLLITALQQLETRQLQTDATFKIMTIPLRENDLRDAAETALRQCAQFADSAEKAIDLIDEANRIRRLTWF